MRGFYIIIRARRERVNQQVLLLIDTKLFTNIALVFL